MVATAQFESSQFPSQIAFVLDPMAAKTCTGVALKCNAFGVPPSLPPFLILILIACTALQDYFICNARNNYEQLHFNKFKYNFVLWIES